MTSGYSTSQKDDRLELNEGTVQPVSPLRNAPEVLSRQTVYLVGTDIVEDNSPEYGIIATAHAAIKGDIILFTSGSYQNREYNVSETTEDFIYLGQTLTPPPSVGVTFKIYRFRLPLVDADGNLQVDIISGGGGGGGGGTVDQGTAGLDPWLVQVDNQLTDYATETTLSALNTKVTACNTGAVVVSSSALPTGAATAANQQTDALTDTQLRATPVPVSLTSTTISGTVAVTQSGIWDEVGINDSGNSITVDNGGTFAVQAAQSGTWNITNVSGTVSLPTGAATAANQSTEITALQLLDDVVATDGSAALTKLYQVGGTDGTNAQILSTNSSGHLNIADGGNSITVDGTVAATQSGTWNVTNVSGTVSLPTGAATAANQSTEITALQLIDDPVQVLGTDTYTEGTSKGFTIGAVRRDADTTLVNTTNEFGPLQMDANGRLKVEAFSGETLPVSLTSTTITGTVAATQSGTWTVQPGNTANTTAWLVQQQRAATATQTTVNDNSSSGTILASNANRLGATIANDSSAVLYLRLSSSAATSTNYTVRMVQYSYYEVPSGYTGAITGIWASDPNDGGARVTEITA